MIQQQFPPPKKPPPQPQSLLQLSLHPQFLNIQESLLFL